MTTPKSGSTARSAAPTARAAARSWRLERAEPPGGRPQREARPADPARRVRHERADLRSRRPTTSACARRSSTFAARQPRAGGRAAARSQCARRCASIRRSTRSFRPTPSSSSSPKGFQFTEGPVWHARRQLPAVQRSERQHASTRTTRRRASSRCSARTAATTQPTSPSTASRARTA